MNRGIRVLQTHALPLGYVAVPGGRAFSLPPSAYAHQQPGIQPGARPAAVACKTMRRLWILLYSIHPQAPGCSNNKWSGRRGSNPLPPPWQGGALPDELRPQNNEDYSKHFRTCQSQIEIIFPAPKRFLSPFPNRRRQKEAPPQRGLFSYQKLYYGLRSTSTSSAAS